MTDWLLDGSTNSAASSKAECLVPELVHHINDAFVYSNYLLLGILISQSRIDNLPKKNLDSLEFMQLISFFKFSSFKIQRSIWSYHGIQCFTGVANALRNRANFSGMYVTANTCSPHRPDISALIVMIQKLQVFLRNCAVVKVNNVVLKEHRQVSRWPQWISHCGLRPCSTPRSEILHSRLWLRPCRSSHHYRAVCRPAVGTRCKRFYLKQKCIYSYSAQWRKHLNNFLERVCQRN